MLLSPISTATFYLSLFTADLAQPKMMFLSSKGFYSTLGTNFLKQVEKKKKKKKGGVSSSPQPQSPREREGREASVPTVLVFLP